MKHTSFLNGMLIAIGIPLTLAFLRTPVASQQATNGITTETAQKIQVAETPYYVYENGEFHEAVLTVKPELIGGKDLMETLIKLNIRYPDKAREMKIGGTVVVSVVINEAGQIDDAFIREGIGGGCNDEALRAVKLMDKVGFYPGEMEGKPVMVRFDIPITFLPQ
jgi:protein TonB